MTELLERYLERFGENFPIFALAGLDDPQIEALLRQALETGEPYRPADPGENVLY